jgi:hypothetical protein
MPLAPDFAAAPPRKQNAAMSMLSTNKNLALPVMFF